MIVLGLDWLGVSEVSFADVRLRGYAATRREGSPMYTKARKDLLRMLARASIAQTLRGTR